MQSMTFHPVVTEIGEQVVGIAHNSIEAGANASRSLTGLVPAGAEEVSAQAARAFASEAASMLAMNHAAQEELMRAGTVFTRIAQLYAEV